MRTASIPSTRENTAEFLSLLACWVETRQYSNWGRWEQLLKRHGLAYFKASECENGWRQFARFVSDPKTITMDERNTLDSISLKFLSLIANPVAFDQYQLKRVTRVTQNISGAASGNPGGSLMSNSTRFGSKPLGNSKSEITRNCHPPATGCSTARSAGMPAAATRLAPRP
jgi:hypothetical protein